MKTTVLIAEAESVWWRKVLLIVLSSQACFCTAFISLKSFDSRRSTASIATAFDTSLCTFEPGLLNCGNRRPSLLEMQLISLANDGAEMVQSASRTSLLHNLLTTIDTGPMMEAEILGDLSHVLTDITPLIGAPTLVFRLSMLIGRVLSLESDYLPDQFIVKDDLFFQLPLLILSAVLAWRSLIPFLRAVTTKTSALDDVVFEQLFQPVGVNSIQFRSLLATCIDWVVLNSGEQVVCENEDPLVDETVYLYWLYEGDVTGLYEGNLWTHIERHNGKSIDDPSAVGFLSDMKFLYRLDMKEQLKVNAEVEIAKYPMATFRVGPKGATLMRIEADALYELMKHDEHLESSIRQLLLKSLQRKVGLLLRSKTQPKPQLQLLNEIEEPSGLSHELEM